MQRLQPQARHWLQYRPSRRKTLRSPRARHRVNGSLHSFPALPEPTEKVISSLHERVPGAVSSRVQRVLGQD